MRGHGAWKTRGAMLVMFGALGGCSLFVSLDDLTSGAADPASGDAATDAKTGDAQPAPSLDGASQGDTSLPQSCLETADPSLAAYYPLDETAGSVAHDCSGNGRDGVVTASTAGGWTAGQFAGGYAFDGNSGCIDLGTPPALLDEAGEFTVAAWALAHSYDFGSGPTAASRYIIGRSAQPNTAGWRLGADPSNIWDAKYRDNSSATSLMAESASGQPTDQWMHVASTFGNGVATLYVNGVAATPATAFTTIVVDTSATVRIGCRDPGNAGFFDGTLDEVRFYNRALSPTEVAALAAKTK